MTPNKIRLMWILFLACCCHLSSVTVAANSPTSAANPDKHILAVGELFSLVITPTDTSGNQPDLITDGLPLSAVLLKNLDGSRTLMWIPEESDIGHSEITLTFIDGNKPEIVSDQTLKLIVAKRSDYPQLKQQLQTEQLTEQQPESEQPLQKKRILETEQVLVTARSLQSQQLQQAEQQAEQQAASEDVQAQLQKQQQMARLTASSDDSASRQSNSDELVRAELEATNATTIYSEPDPESDPEEKLVISMTDARLENSADKDSANAVVEPSDNVQREPALVPVGPVESGLTKEEIAEVPLVSDSDFAAENTAQLPAPETDMDTVPDSDTNAIARVADNPASAETTTSSQPYIQIDNEIFITQGSTYETELAIKDDHEAQHNVQALNLPQNATLENLSAGLYWFSWRPVAVDIGTTAVLFRLKNKDTNEIAHNKRVRFVVAE